MVAFVSAFGGAALSRPTAFSGVRLSSRATPVASRVSMDASKSVPFLDRPAKLDGSLPGDVGFDPLGFSNMFDVNFLREAEVKHGTILNDSHVMILSVLPVQHMSMTSNT